MAYKRPEHEPQFKIGDIVKSAFSGACYKVIAYNSLDGKGYIYKLDSSDWHEEGTLEKAK